MQTKRGAGKNYLSAFSDSEPKSRICWLASLLAVLGMMALIYWFSAQTADTSSGLSGGICTKLVRFADRILGLGVDREGIRQLAEMIETPLRKCSHFLEYLLLGMAVETHFSIAENIFFASGEQGEEDKTGGADSGRIRRIIFFAVLFSMLYACTDEFHQIFVPGRACRAADVLIDTAGALTGALIANRIKTMCKTYHR